MLTILIMYFVILELKVIRDIINYRLSWSILSKLPAPLLRFIIGKQTGIAFRGLEDSFDGWHVADALMIAIPWIYIIADKYSLLVALIGYIPFWIVFYQLFNFQYHWLWMMPKHREKWLFR